MIKQILSITSIIFLSFIFGCTSKGQDMRQVKNDCYTTILNDLQNEPIYKEAMLQFEDTFKIMKNDKRYFGAPPGFDNKIDEAIFFNKSKTECLLIVLQRNIYDLVFAQARMIRGTFQGKKWVFKPSMEYIFEKGYYKLYPENSFENISKLARYNVLTDGEVKKKGCEIDEDYWFVHLKQ